MNKYILYKLATIIVFPCLLSSCSPEKANAESPCPSSINSAKIILLDSISNEPITTATIVLAGKFHDNSDQQLSDSEVTIDYSSELQSYYLPYENDVEIDISNLTIYATDSFYNSNVSKPSYFDKTCTELEYIIYLCPNGTACR